MKKCFILLASLLFLSFPDGLKADDTFQIDLMNQDIYVSKGFSPEWINRTPEGPRWMKIPGGHSRRIRLSIPELKIEGLPEKRWFSFKRNRPETVTILIQFHLDAVADHDRIYGLFFSYIGGCWEIYLNGTMLKSEMHLDGNGNIDYITNSRNIAIPVKPDLLKEENILTIKIVGDPAFVKTGIYQHWPNIIADFETANALHFEIFSLLLLSIYFFIGIYHLFLFILRRSEVVNLYFGLLCIFLFANQFFRTSSVYNLIKDSTIINRIELIFLYGLLPFLALFIDCVLFGGTRRITRNFSQVFIVFAVFSALAPMPAVYDLVHLWEKFIAAPILIYIVFIVVRNFLRNLGTDSSRISAGRKETPIRFFKGLFLTTSGRILLALIVIVLCVFTDIILKRYFFIHINPARFGFFVLIIGTTLNLADNFLYIHKNVESLNISLNEKISDLNSAYEKISVSEEKYRMLIEGVNHYICTTDLDGNMLSANNKLIYDLHLDPDSVTEINIIDLFYFPPDDKGVTRRFISEKIKEAAEDKKQVSFKAQMKPYFQIEPREMSVYFEIVNIASAQEILVKAYDTMEDSLLKNMISETQVLEMGNYLSVAEEISNRLVRNVERYYDSRRITILRIALREMILNAIEHGNLDISYHIKTEALDSDRYFEFIAQRQNDPRFRDKKVVIEYALTPEKLVYIIRDDGNGFDHRNMITRAVSDANEKFLSHGRGIAMTMNAFDEVVYNDRGNEVTLIKYFLEKAGD